MSWVVIISQPMLPSTGSSSPDKQMLGVCLSIPALVTNGELGKVHIGAEGSRSNMKKNICGVCDVRLQKISHHRERTSNTSIHSATIGLSLPLLGEGDRWQSTLTTVCEMNCNSVPYRGSNAVTKCNTF